MTRRDLPAPYESPWRQLGRDLRAVLASSRLKLRELWRRNGEADLPRPSFWPQALAPLFWPLVLAAVLLMASAVVQLWPQVPPATRPAEISAPESTGLAAPSGAVAPVAPEPTLEAPSPQDLSDTSNPLAEPTEDPTEQPSEEFGGDLAGDMAEVADQEESDGAPAGGPGEDTPPDPLLEAFRAADPQQWISAILPRPDGRTLALTLSPAFVAEAATERREQAEGWRLQAEALGYERLELSDGQGVLLGRTALVGSGMILLEPPQPP